MRIAGRGFDNTAKALKTDNNGAVVTGKENTMQNIAWTWHTFPMAVHVPQVKKTFAGGVMRGGTDAGHKLFTIDDETHEIEGVQISTRYAGDDHNMVALLNQPTKNRLVVFYTGHSNGDIYYRFVQNYDLDNLSAEYAIPDSAPATYINVHATKAGEPIYILSRNASSGLSIHISQDDGTTWTKRVLYAKATHYLDAGKARGSSDTIGITLTGHGGTGTGAIYYGYLNINGELCLPNGNVIANVLTGENLPLSDISELKLVAENANSKTTVSSTNSTGHRLTFIDCPNDESFQTFNYKYAQYNSSTDSFDIVEVMSGVRGNLMGGSHAHYVGSCHDVGINEPIILCSNFNLDKERWEMWEFTALTRNDIPAGWGKTLVATDKLKLFRPVAVLSDSGEVKPVEGLWLKGYYSHYRNYYTTAQTSYDFSQL